MCNQRINTWNIHKNYKASEKEEAARILRSYKDNGRRTPVIMIKGRPAQHHRIERHCKSLSSQNSRGELLSNRIVRSASREFFRNENVFARDSSQFHTTAQQTFRSTSPDPIPPLSTPFDLKLPEFVFYKVEQFCQSYFDTGMSTVQYKQANADLSELVTKYYIAITLLHKERSLAWQILPESFDKAKDVLIIKSPRLINCIAYMAIGDLLRFPGLFERVWHHISDLSLALLGFDHPITVLCKYVEYSGSSSESYLRLIRQLYAISKSRAGEFHIDTIRFKVDLCEFLRRDPGGQSEVETLLDQTIADCDRIYGRCHRLTLQCMYARSVVFYWRHDFDAAERLMRQMLMRSKECNRQHNRTIAYDTKHLAIVLAKQKKYAESETLLERAICESSTYFGLRYQTIDTIDWLVYVLEKQKKFAEVEQLRQRYPYAF